MQPLQQFDGIEGLTGREPVGACLTIGKKGPGGNPVETDRFYFVSPLEEVRTNGDKQIRFRPEHPAFAKYNAAAVENRRILRGNLVHSRREDCWHFYLRAQVLGGKWPAHPNRIPACTGDGKTARRLYAVGEDRSKDDWRDIPCPNELCEFRLGNVKACKPFGRFYFRPRWPDGNPLPTPLVKLTTGSWNSVSAFTGFFDYVEAQAAALGVKDPNLYGLPFTVSLTRKTQPQQQRAFPVLTITPEIDLIDFFLAQVERRRSIAGAPEPLALPPVSAQDAAENDPGVIDADYTSITPSAPVAVPPDPGPETPKEPARSAPEYEPPATLSAAALIRIRKAAALKHLTDEQVSSMAGARLEDAPAGAETEILRAIERHKPTRR